MDADPDSSLSQSNDELAFHDLALRLLSNGGWRTVEELLVGHIPERWPIDIPILEYGQVIGSLVTTSTTASSHSEMFVILTTDLPADEALEEYDDRLVATDWIVADSQERCGGFSGHIASDNLEYLKDEQGPRLKISARAAADGLTEIRLHLDGTPRSVLASGLERENGELESTLLMPSLRPPRDAQIGPSSQNGNAHSWNSNTELTSGLDTLPLIAHYAERLRRAGWVFNREERTGPVTWSTWDVKDLQGDDWAGMLLVVEQRSKQPARKRRYYLSAHVYRVR
jgi:hypothetical protein